jgi:phosphopantothenoylcysteine decarboxylase/phosphopantothenate--cysteine ligase
MARILLGVSGGIAAYKALELARLATLAGHGVRVVMTEAASRFVGAASFEGIVGAPVLTSEFERDPLRGAFPGEAAEGHDPIGHLELAGNCDAYLVAPAMNDRMYADAATQANLETLRSRGIEVIEPEEGKLASRGEFGRGRLPDPEQLLARLEASLPAGNRPWDGLRVLVTAGGTREPIDPVRFIGNRSSGRMGIALAAAAAKRGAEVTLIAANVALPAPAGVRRIDVETTEQLAAAAAEEFPATQVLLMAAAPADFRATDPSAGKLQRSGSLDLALQPTEDILASLTSRRREGQTIVGFAAEHGGEAAARARGKLERKGADLIVLNDVSNPEIGFESDRNAVTLIAADGETEVPIDSKDAVAESILGEVDRLRANASRPSG